MTMDDFVVAMVQDILGDIETMAEANELDPKEALQKVLAELLKEKK